MGDSKLKYSGVGSPYLYFIIIKQYNYNQKILKSVFGGK